MYEISFLDPVPKVAIAMTVNPNLFKIKLPDN